MIWEEWVLDCSSVNHEHIPCFCPIEDREVVVWGMNVLQGRCPGNLVGVVHQGGQKECEKWVEKNPDWHAKYCRVE